MTHIENAMLVVKDSWEVNVPNFKEMFACKIMSYGNNLFSLINKENIFRNICVSLPNKTKLQKNHLILRNIYRYTRS